MVHLNIYLYNMKSINFQSQWNNTSWTRTKLWSAIAIFLIFTISLPADAQNNTSNIKTENIIKDSTSNEITLILKSMIQDLGLSTDTLLARTFREIDIDSNTIKKDFIPILENIKSGLKKLKMEIDILDNDWSIYENDLVKYKEYSELLMEYTRKIDNLNENIKRKPYIFKSH